MYTGIKKFRNDPAHTFPNQSIRSMLTTSTFSNTKNYMYMIY